MLIESCSVTKQHWVLCETCGKTWIFNDNELTSDLTCAKCGSFLDLKEEI